MGKGLKRFRICGLVGDVSAESVREDYKTFSSTQDA